MARVIQGIVTKHNLTPVPMVVVNKAGGAGGEGFLDIKASRGNPHKLDHHAVEPVHHPARDRHSVLNWKDMTPVAMMALDEFVLWVNADNALQERQGIYGGGQGCAGRHA